MFEGNVIFSTYRGFREKNRLEGFLKSKRNKVILLNTVPASIYILRILVSRLICRINTVQVVDVKFVYRSRKHQASINKAYRGRQQKKKGPQKSCFTVWRLRAPVQRSIVLSIKIIMVLTVISETEKNAWNMQTDVSRLDLFLNNILFIYEREWNDRNRRIKVSGDRCFFNRPFWNTLGIRFVENTPRANNTVMKTQVYNALSDLVARTIFGTPFRIKDTS